MARVRLKDGREARLLRMGDCTLGDVIDLEKRLEMAAESWSVTMENAALLYHSLVAAFGDEAPSWAEVMSYRPADLSRISEDDDPDPDADPLAPDAGHSPHPPDDVDPAANGSTLSNSSTSPSATG